MNDALEYYFEKTFDGTIKNPRSNENGPFLLLLLILYKKKKKTTTTTAFLLSSFVEVPRLVICTLHKETLLWWGASE